MASRGPTDNNCGNQDPFLRLGEQLSQNEAQRNRRECCMPDPFNLSHLLNEFYEEAYGQNLQTFRTDRLLNEVIDIESNMRRPGPQLPPPPVVVGEIPKIDWDTQPNPPFPLDRYFRPNPVSHPIYPPYPILPPPVFIEPPPPHPRILNNLSPILASPFSPVQCTVEDLKTSWDWPPAEGADKDLSKEGASGSSKDEMEKSKNDEEEGACAAPQASKFSLGNPSSEESQKGADASSEMDERASSLELDTIVEETEAADQDVEMLKFDSERTGLRKRSLAQANKDLPSGKRDADTKETKVKGCKSAKHSVEDDEEKSTTVQGSGTIEITRNGKRLEILEKYRFEDFNPMAGLEDPFDEGMRNLCSGNVAFAALCLEAAINCNPPIPFPDSAAAWLCLGISQAANEQDILAIIALKKYLAFEPDNLHALIFLTTSYMYENFKNLATIGLWDWLDKNPKYSNLVKISPPIEMCDVAAPLDREFHQKVTSLYLKAANKIPRGRIDPDVQCGLGLLYSMVGEYDKASDCFKTAVLMDPCDEMMWNHLGEALANGNKCTESMEAYYNALNLRPRYTRARYNLGLCCSKMGDHEEAVKHFLRALTVQAKSSRGLVGRMSETIWGSVKTSMRYLRRPELTESVDKRDLVTLNRIFEVD